MFGNKNAPQPTNNQVPGTTMPQQETVSPGTQNVISKGTVIKGDLETAGSLKLEGKVKGHIKCTGTFVLGQGAVIEGDLLATKAELAGEVLGNVEVSELLTLKSTANIKGDLFTAKLVIEVGAMFNGNCNMGAATKQINLGQQAAAGAK